MRRMRRAMEAVCRFHSSDEEADTAAIIKKLDEIAASGIVNFCDNLNIIDADALPIRTKGNLGIKGLSKGKKPKLTVAWGLVAAGYMTHKWGEDMFPMDHFLSVCPTTLTVDLLEKALLAVEKCIDAVGASRGDPRTPVFEGCSPSPLLPSVASDAAANLVGFESVGAASAPSGKRSLARARGARALEGLEGAVEVVVEAVEGVGVVVGVVSGVAAVAAAVEVAWVVVVAEGAEAAEVAEEAEVAEVAEVEEAAEAAAAAAVVERHTADV
ncbi:unnamed protein product [Closterium sp. NIES-64]|nr:unnamed protein product [Closterium sp. NIES-64]